MTAQSLGFDVTADTSGLLAQMMAAGNMTEKQAARMLKSIQSLDAQVKVWTKSQQAANNEVARIGKAANDAESYAAASTHAGTATSGITRELIVLGHELSQGNFKRFGGSLLVLAEYSKTATAALSYLVGPLGVVVGLTALAGVAFIEGEHQSAAFVKSLALTGNAAGLTADQMDRLVTSTSKATGAGLGAARDALQALVSSGQFGPNTIGPAAQAVLRLEKVSGESSEAIVKDFEKMNEGVAKWATEHNRQYNFLTAAYYDQIKHAEELGNKEGAMALVIDRLNERLNMNASFWDKVKLASSQAWDEFVGNGRDETVGQQLASINAQIAALDRMAAARARLPAFTSAPGSRDENNRGDLETQRRVLLMDQLRAAENASAAAETARVQKAGVAAHVLIDQVLQETKGRESINRELEKYNRLFAEAAAAGKPYSDEQQKAVLDEVRRRNTHKDNFGETFVKQLQRQVEEQQRGRTEMLLLEAAQKNVSAAAAPYIFKLADIEDRTRRIARIVADTAEEEKQAAKIAEFRSGSDAILKGYIDQAEEIGKTADEMARLNVQRQIENNLRKAMVGANSDTLGGEDGLYAAAKKGKAAALDQLNALQRAKREFNADPNNGVKPALVSYFDEATNKAKLMSDTIAGSLKAGEDAFVQFAQTGKLSMGSLFSYIAEQWLRGVFKTGVTSAITAGGGAGNFSFGALFSNWFGSVATPHANGLDSVPYDGYAAILHKGERVQTAVQARSGAGNNGPAVIDASINGLSVGAGVSLPQVHAAVNQAVALSQQQIMRSLRQQGVAA